MTSEEAQRPSENASKPEYATTAAEQGTGMPGGDDTDLGAQPAISRTKAGSFWIALIIGIIALVIVLVFILQNLHDAKASFVSAHWDIPLGIDLLFAAILGGLIVFVAGATRIFQLRRAVRRQHHALHQAQVTHDERTA